MRMSYVHNRHGMVLWHHAGWVLVSLQRCRYTDSSEEVQGTRKMFPAFAAGAYATPSAMLTFLQGLQRAYHGDTTLPIAPATARTMLTGTDRGCKAFMGVLMGVGVFVGEAGPNRLAIHQGANDGFRSVYVHCFDGPDAGTGVVVTANGDNRAMFCVAETLQLVLTEMGMQGVDVSQFYRNGDSVLSVDNVPQEEIVNYGYKNVCWVGLCRLHGCMYTMFLYCSYVYLISD